MAIITISRGSYYRGKAVAEKLAARLGYDCLSRDEVVESLGPFHLPEIKLVGDLHDAFSVLDRFPNGKSRFITAIRCELLSRFCGDKVVYHGLGGHYFLKGVTHVLKARITADLEDRVHQESARSGASLQEARYKLQRDDEERRRWCLYLYGIDIWNPNDYDIALRIDRVSVDDAVDILATTAGLASFAPTEASRNVLADMALTARVQCILTDYPNAVVHTVQGQVTVTLKAPLEQKPVISDTIMGLLSEVPGAGSLDLQILPYY